MKPKKLSGNFYPLSDSIPASKKHEKDAILKDTEETNYETKSQAGEFLRYADKEARGGFPR